MLRFRRDRAANTPPVSTGIGHRRCEPARPPRNALRRFTFVRHHDAPMASFRPALTETRQRNRPSTGRPVNSGPRPCLFDVGFPLSGLQDRTYTSDLNIRAQHTRSPLGARCAANPRALPERCPHPALPSSVRALSYSDTVNSQRVHGAGGGPSAETPCFWLTTYQIAANQVVSGRRLPWKIVPAVTDVSW